MSEAFCAIQHLHTPDSVSQWLNQHNMPDFPTLASYLKKNHAGVIPVNWNGASTDDLASIFGYKITVDRKGFYARPQVATAATLMQKKLTPPKFAVDGLLPAGLCIFSAPSKTGKSWLALDLCNSIATGTPFMGYQVNQGDALYLALEDSEYGLQKRMKKTSCASSACLQYAFSAPSINSGLTDFLDEWCNSIDNPRLIVIDVLQCVKPAGNGRQTAYEFDYSLYLPLNTFALKRGISIVGITHNRKSSSLASDDFESISGSVGQMGAAQTTWIIKGKRGQGEDKIFKALGRDIREVEDVIHFDPDTCHWVNMGNVESAAAHSATTAYQNSPIRKTLIDLVDNSGGGSWYGTYADLFEAIAEKTGKYPFNSPTDLSNGIRTFFPLLQQHDGILHKKDSNHGKYHKFYRDRLQGA